MLWVPPKTYELESFDEARRSAYHEWYQLRVENIRSHVSAADVLARNGVTLRKHGLQAEQISCPFHGKDNRPSAKYFPEEAGGRSHVWCFVCRENWDAIGLWKKFTGSERFSDVLRQLEQAFGLTAPEPPTTRIRERAEVNPLADESRQLLNLCESRLREHRRAFEMRSHLRLGALLDHTRFYLDSGHIDHATAIARLKSILSRIREKVDAKAPADP